MNQCAAGDTCVSSSISLSADVGQPLFTRYIFGAGLFLASFSAMALATKRFRRGGDDGFVLMNDVEQ